MKFTTSYKGKTVLITGNTGFKGSWLALWLQLLGANVIGYSIDIPTKPALHTLLKLRMTTVWGDVCDLPKLKKVMNKYQPDIVFHLAAQPLVRTSYKKPVDTFLVNTIGTANVLEAIRSNPKIKAGVMITTDKVYDNIEKDYAYQEADALGGYDPYSASKGAAEIVIASYRNSFFNNQEYGKTHTTLIASARAGNVIGGGDFAEDRLIPDFIRAILAGTCLNIRRPKAIRPWQHVLEPLSGYLLLGAKLLAGDKKFATAWNFGPEKSDVKPVQWIVEKMCAKWGNGSTYAVDKGVHPHEALYLKLNITKAKKQLGWQPRWNLETALDKIIVWTKVYAVRGDVLAVCRQQIKEYSEGKAS